MRILHKWLGLIVGLQVLLWVVSGLAMNLLDPAKVSGENVAAFEHDSQAMQPSLELVEPTAIVAKLAPAPIVSLELKRQHGFWVWHARTPTGVQLFDARTAERMLIDRDRARAIAEQTYFGDGTVRFVTHVAHDNMEVRDHTLPVWRVDFNDEFNTRYYVSQDDGRILERRNDTWALFDVFWMLHTMDYVGRDNFNNPQVIAFGFGALWLAISGVLLVVHWLRSRRRAARQLVA